MTVQPALQHTYTTREPHFRRVMGDLLGSPLTTGNAVTTLVNGEEFYPAQLDAFRAAKRSITLETFMYWAGDIGRKFSETLAERARAGVDVHVIIDAIGSAKIDPDDVQLMIEAGVRVIRYNPVRRLVRFVKGDPRARTHRKITVIDGRVAFTGGAGVADHWQGDARHTGEWRDTFYRIEGPIVANLQSTFVENWLQSTGELLDGEQYFPSLEPVGELPANVIRSAPSEGLPRMQIMYLVAINAATETVDMATPYFIPDDALSDTMQAAMQRGVRIRLIIPGPHIDHPLARPVSRATWKPLLEAGLELYQFQPSMYHNKATIVDGIWTSIGSSNLDPLSFRFNDEANVNIYDPQFAAGQIELLETDIARSRRITELRFEKRSWRKRLRELLSQPLKPVL